MSAGEIMPCDGITSAAWMLKAQNTEVADLSGASVSVELGPAYWEISIEAELYSRPVFDLWSAFIARRQGAAVPFTAYRPFKQKPADTGISSDAGLTIDAFNAGLRTVDIGGAGAWIAKAGDMFSYFTAGSGYWLGQLTADRTASGGDVSLLVEPAPRTPHPSLANPRRIQALGEFRLNGEPRFREGHKRRTLRFTAKQVIR